MHVQHRPARRLRTGLVDHSGDDTAFIVRAKLERRGIETIAKQVGGHLEIVRN
jgi:squalene cyclase